MAANNQIAQVLGFLCDPKLEEYLKTAETIAKLTNIPFLPLVIRILGWLITARPLVRVAQKYVEPNN